MVSGLWGEAQKNWIDKFFFTLDTLEPLINRAKENSFAFILCYDIYWYFLYACHFNCWFSLSTDTGSILPSMIWRKVETIYRIGLNLWLLDRWCEKRELTMGWQPPLACSSWKDKRNLNACIIWKYLQTTI